MLPGVYNNLLFVAADTFELALNWKDSDGNLFLLDGWNGRMAFLRSPIDELVVKQITSPDNIVLGNTEPNIYCVIDKDQTTLSSRPFYYILELIDPSGKEIRLLNGTLDYRTSGGDTTPTSP